MASVFIFPGQGSQDIGMGKALCEAFSTARQVFEEAESLMSFNLRRLMFEGPLEELSQTRYAQPALFTLSCAVWQQIKDSNPLYVAGHSLGEYSALYAAGCFDFSTGFTLVNRRGHLMAETTGGAMMALVGADVLHHSHEFIAQETSCCLANDNSPNQLVLSGPREALERILNAASQKGLRAIMLNVSGAFHSPFMTKAQLNMEPHIRSSLTQKARIPVITNVSAKTYRDPETLQQHLIDQMTHQVLWRSTMAFLNETQELETAWEVGPRRVLAGLARHGMPRLRVNALATPQDIDNFYTLQA